MDKLVVPQFVATWFERNKKGHTIYGLLHLFSDNYYLFDDFRKWVEDYNLKEEDAQEIIAKMYLFQNYEVEEKKYYWRKKKEYLCNFEKQWDIYLNFDDSDDSVRFSVNKFEGGYIKTKFTEVEVLNLVGEEDFNKLERVEIDDVQ